MAAPTRRVTLKVVGDAGVPVAIGFVRVPLDASLQAVRAQAEEHLPGLPQYHFRISGGVGDAWEMRGSVPVASQQETSEPSEDTVYLALGPARTAVAHGADVFAASDTPNPFVRGFARGVYAADYAAATKHAADAARRAAPLATAPLPRGVPLTTAAPLPRHAAGRTVGRHADSPAETDGLSDVSGQTWDIHEGGPCPFDRPTIASEMRQLQSSERAARNRELSDREIKLSPVASSIRTAAGGAPHGNSTPDAEPEAEQITPERSSHKSHGRPYRRHPDERTAADACATKRQLFAPSQQSAANLPRQPSVGPHGPDATGCRVQDAAGYHSQYFKPQPQPQPQPTLQPLPQPQPQVDCASFTLGNLQSELENLRSDAHLVLEQLSAECHPQEAGYDHRTLFATSQLTMTPPNLLAHLRRATSSISTISVTASPAKPMAQARRGIGLRCGGPEVRVRVSGCGPPRDHHHHPSCAQGFDLDPHYVDLHHVVAFGSRRPQRSCSTLATHMVPTLGRSGSVRGVY